MRPDGAAAPGLTVRLVDLVSSMRAKGVSVGTSEVSDAASALTVTGVTDRADAKEALASTLVRREADLEVFDALFNLWFAAGRATESPETRGPADLQDDLAAALKTAEVQIIGRIAEAAVRELGVITRRDGAVSGYSALQALEAMDKQRVLSLAVGADEVMGYSLAAARSRRGWEDFVRRVRGEAQAQTAGIRGASRIATHSVCADISHRDFLNATPQELAEMERLVSPLARRLASALATKSRRASKGEIDLRGTLRSSARTGGVPLRPVYRRRPPRRTRLVVLCDVSGSVAGFSGFTALLLQALGHQFTRTRLFPFVNQVAEATDELMQGGRQGAPLLASMAGDPRLVSDHYNSDYGRVLRQFADELIDCVGPRTTVLILGDARSNGQPLDTDALHRIGERAQRVIWFNPERTSLWGTGDSAALEYGGSVPMHECRNATQLEGVVARLMPVR